MASLKLRGMKLIKTKLQNFLFGDFLLGLFLNFWQKFDRYLVKIYPSGNDKISTRNQLENPSKFGPKITVHNLKFKTFIKI